jgi:hypothetical protein
MNESPPYQVPKGWTRGHKLRCIAKGNRHALFQSFDPKVDFDPTVKTIGADHVFALEFESEEAAQGFVDWWFASTVGDQ